jgi:pyruvate kinase
VHRRSYEVVATLGPATASPEHAVELVRAGATALRLNSSHIAPDRLREWVDALLRVVGGTPIVIDLQGSKWRVGELEPFELAVGSRVEMRLARGPTEREVIPVPHEDFFRAASQSDRSVLMDDARIELGLEVTGTDFATAVVVRPGVLRPRKGITLPSTTFRRERLTEADAEAVRDTQGIALVSYAVSYVKDGTEARRYRSFLGKHGMVSKLERPSALEDASAIAAVSDCLWLCRGDLGAEMGLAAMAEAVHRFGLSLRASPVPVLLAGQVLEHMTEHPEPTRSEICHLHDILSSGYAGVVLSDETAVGRFPVQSVRVASAWRESPTA